MSNAESAGLRDQDDSQSPRDKSRKWRLRPRLLLLIAIPTVAALALGGSSIAGSWQSAGTDQRSETMAGLSTKVTQLAFQLESERDAIVWYISAGGNGRASGLTRHASAASKDQLQIVQQQFSFTAPWLKTVTTGVATVGSSYPRAAQQAAKAVTAALHVLPNLRNLALNTQVAAADVLGDYNNLLDQLLAFDDQVPLNNNDAQLISTARAMAAISRYDVEGSVQRAIVMYGLTADALSSGMLAQLNTSMANQKADLAEFQNFATSSQSAMFGRALSYSLQDRVQADEQAVIQHANDVQLAAIVPQDWYGAETDTITSIHKFEETLAQSVVDRARSLHDRAVTSALVVGGILVLVLIFSVLFAMYVGRFMPERRRPVTALGLSASS